MLTIFLKCLFYFSVRLNLKSQIRYAIYFPFKVSKGLYARLYTFIQSIKGLVKARKVCY